MFSFTKTLTCVAAATAMTLGSAVAGPYDEYAGSTLVVNFPAHPHYDAVRKILPEFTKETGIEVEVDQLPYLKMRERQTLELGQEDGEYDLIAYVVFSKADYVYADQLENLARYFMNPKLSDPSYDETSILGYRKDIFEKHGLSVPETYEEMLELACKIPELEPGMGGLSSRAASGHHASHAFLLHLAPLGGRIFDDAWNPIVNNAAGVQAAEALKKIVDCGPEGASSFGFGEALASFLAGDTAMFLDTTIVAGQIDNPEKSNVVGKVGWALHPMGTRRGSQTGGFGIGIPKNAENKEAAFLLMQWLTSKKGDKLVALAGGNPSRFSTHADAEVNAKFPHMKTFGEALEHADPDWRPIIPVWGKVNADLGTTLSKVLTEDLDIQEALDGVAERTKALMEEAGYYTWQ